MQQVGFIRQKRGYKPVKNVGVKNVPHSLAAVSSHDTHEHDKPMKLPTDPDFGKEWYLVSLVHNAVTVFLVCLKSTNKQRDITALDRHHHYHHHHHLSDPLTARVVWATQMISQPVFSIFPFPHCSLGLGELQACRFPVVVFPPLYPVCLVFFPLSLCFARWFWPDLMYGRHDHTTAVRVSLRSSGDLRVVQLPAGSWHGLPRW